MKKVYSCLLALTIVLLSAATLVLPAVADVPSYVAGIENGFGYGILEDGTAIVLDFPYDKENIVIPDTLGGHTVTEIADDAYHNAPAFLPSNIVSLSVPASLRAFGNSVFYYAGSLREIILRPGNTAFTLDENGVLFNKGKTENRPPARICVCDCTRRTHGKNRFGNFSKTPFPLRCPRSLRPPESGHTAHRNCRLFGDLPK